MNSKNCIILRTNHIDECIENKAIHLEKITGYDVIICIDCIFSDIQYNLKCKFVKLTKEFLLENGLLILNNTGWLCGDYSYYCVSKTFGDYEFYWMIEPDVFLNFDDPNIFKKIDDFNNNNFDYISSYFNKANEGWYWTKIIGMFYEKQLYSSFFAITRISKKSIKYLMIDRLRLSNMFYINNNGQFPNDESFVATSLMNGDFKCCDINYFGDFYSKETLNYAIPFSLTLLESGKKDNKIYHPALSGLDFMRKVKKSIDEGYINDSNIEKIHKPFEVEKQLLGLIV